MNNVNANTNTDKEEIKYLTLDDIDKMWKESEPADWGMVTDYHSVGANRYQNLITHRVESTKIKIERLPADHAKLLLDFYNLFDENEPYKDKEGTPYRDNLLNDLYYNIYKWNYTSPNGKKIFEFDIDETTSEKKHLGRGKTVIVNITNKVGTEKIPVLDKNQKIEKLKKSFDIFKRLKERDLVLASMYAKVVKSWGGKYYLEYYDYYGNMDTHCMLIDERRLLAYIKHFFSKVNPRAFIFISEEFPNVEVTENMMAQYLEYNGR